MNPQSGEGIRPPIAVRVEALLKKRSIAWRRPSGGYTNAQRWLVRFEDGFSCFVKAGADDRTSGLLRHEYAKVYSRLHARFVARCLAWEDDAAMPLLILEDLSGARWPPPWSEADIEGVLQTLADVRGATFGELPSLEEWDRAYFEGRLRIGWSDVQQDRAAFLRLGLVSAKWLTECLPELIAASEAADFAGDDALHLDVRSDNLCFSQDRVVLIDWNNTCRGNGLADIAFWLPSLQAEGGPAPESILPDAPELAAVGSGYWAARAGLPAIPHAPLVRQVQFAQLRTSLAWAARVLGLPAPDGPSA